MKILAMTVLVLLPALLLAGLARSVYRRGAFTEITRWWRGASRPMKVALILFATLAICYGDAFGYNRRSEVTNACISGSATAYGYDEIGNSSRYSANSLNQYTDFAYDADGNMLTDGIFSFAYDGAGRLKSVSSNGVVIVANDYDSMSRRVRKTTPEYEAVYFYDDWNLVEERVAWTNGESTAFRYYWGKDLSESLQGAGGVGGLLYMTVDEAVYVPCYDNNGNITCYLDETGAAVAEYVYDAFGNTVSATGPLAGLFHHRFSTKYLDSEMGLYYYGYRFYHPQLMRWLTRDPIEEEGGSNLYAMCENSLLCVVDRLGNIAVTDIPAIMDANKWNVGASLMRHWFSLDSNLPTTPNETIVTMDWVLSFKRAKDVYDKIFSEKLYVNNPAQKEIVSMIKRTKKGIDGAFCPLNRPASLVESDYINTRQVGSVFDSPDDLMAALGHFSFRVAVSGYVKGKCAVITDVGVFVRDSYDFDGNQMLGYWNKVTNYAGKNPLKGDRVTNASFRSYAKATGKGAGFLVYSDIKVTALSKAEKVRITP